MEKGTIGRRGGQLDRRLFAALLTVGALVILGVVGYMSGGGIAGAAYYYYYGGPGPPANLTLAPVTATNTVGTTHTVTATVTDSSGTVLPNVVVRFTVTGSVSTSGQCTTDASGQCTFSYAGPVFPGADLISAFADSNGNGRLDTDAGEPSATAMKSWVLPPSTLGHITGGGTILKGTSDFVAFGFDAKRDTKSIKGGCNVIDRDARRMIKCADISAIVVNGNTATIYGHAVDSSAGGTTFVIKVVDNGEPGTADTFSITTASGYSASGTLTGGNIQVH